jgi:hypothetical protein
MGLIILNRTIGFLRTHGAAVGEHLKRDPMVQDEGNDGACFPISYAPFSDIEA